MEVVITDKYCVINEYSNSYYQLNDLNQ